MGGFMSVRLALELPEKIAAAAPVAAQLAVALENETPLLPISIMIVNGTEDPIVPFDGGEVRLFSGGRSRGKGKLGSSRVVITRCIWGGRCSSKEARAPPTSLSSMRW